ncbi:uncharacterized protein LOC142318206 isoform X2 [Lycorma delicatula]|uniref:uncharacterized protein LOC142318206 isoform X2 n=1 Tax=Lycorma delicatula TaxID=130591 RepID=UPI003F50FBE8
MHPVECITRKMWCLDYRMYLCILCLSSIITELSGAVSKNVSGVQNSAKQTKSAFTGLSDANGGYYALKAAPASSSSSRGLGISAWGIIAVILTAVIGGIAAYYVALFYPIVCKKERKYDIMELTTV